jgi:CRISPR/Cas system-associated protein Cas7 (RAMP superfamily)
LGNSKLEFNNPFDVFVVYFVDGACFNEYQAVQEVAKKTEKLIYYGGSSVFNANELIQEVEKCI